MRLGDDMRKTGDAASAAEVYRSAAAAAPHDPKPLIRLGQALAETGDAVRAEEAFRTALALSPGDRDAQRGLAIALLAQGRPAEALPLLQALERSGADARLFAAEGTALDMLGRHSEAQAAYRRGLAADPLHASLHGNLALSYALAGDDARAMESLRAAVGAPQPDPRQEANAVLVLALLGRTDEASARGTQSVGAAATESLLARAAEARAEPDPIRKVRLLGVLTSGTSRTPAPATSAAAGPQLPPVVQPGAGVGKVGAAGGPAPAGSP